MGHLGANTGLPPHITSVRGPSMMPSLPHQAGLLPPPILGRKGPGWGEHEWDGLEVVRGVSEGVEVTVSTLLMPEESLFLGPRIKWVWTYRVGLRLLGAEAQVASGARRARRQVQLLSREWVIEDAAGEEVDRGEESEPAHDARSFVHAQHGC